MSPPQPAGPEEHDPGAPPQPDRRGAVGTLVTVGTLAYAGALAVPAALFLAPPSPAEGGSHERWVRVCRLADLRPGEPHRFAARGDLHDAYTVARDVEIGAVWVERRGDAVEAWSAVCPHLGCAVTRAPSGDGFACPCHASRFDPGGAVVSGPSPRALDRLAARVTDGFVEVDVRRYRLGTADRVEAAG
jgi:cytochrome b6-f complex iron-sulfur subunit/menaquinol-cytochrome c reductase iron-sulfur subunit